MFCSDWIHTSAKRNQRNRSTHQQSNAGKLIHTQTIRNRTRPKADRKDSSKANNHTGSSQGWKRIPKTFSVIGKTFALKKIIVCKQLRNVDRVQNTYERKHWIVKGLMEIFSKSKLQAEN